MTFLTQLSLFSFITSDPDKHGVSLPGFSASARVPATYSLLGSRSDCTSRSHSLSTPLLLTAWLRAASLPLISAATAASPRPLTASPESLLTQDLGTFGGWNCHCFFSGCPFWRLCEVTPQVSWHTFPPPTFCHMPMPGPALSIYPTCPPLFAQSFCQSWLLCWSVMSPQALPVTSPFPRGCGA